MTTVTGGMPPDLDGPAPRSAPWTAAQGAPWAAAHAAPWAAPDGRHDAAPRELDGRRPGTLSASVTALWTLVLGFAVSAWGAAGWAVAALLADGAAAADRWRAAAGCGGVTAACLVAGVLLAVVAASGRHRRGR